MSSEFDQPDSAVMDANEQKQQRRLNAILDALEEIESDYQDAKGMYVAGRIDKRAKNIHVMYAVQRAIRETYNLINNNDDIWQAKEFGAIERERDDPIQVQGLEDYLFFPEFVKEQYEIQTDKRNCKKETEVKEVNHTMPEQISIRVLLNLKQYLNDNHGLDIGFETLEVDEEANPF